MKKLIPAICMTLIAAFMLASSTFAWFSMNTTVTAQDMQVTAKSDQAFMIIGAGHTTSDAITTLKATKAISADATNRTATLLPTAHETIANMTAADELSNWYYEVSNDPSSATGTGVKTTLDTIGSFTNYVLVNEFSITLADGSNAMSNIKVGTCTITTASTSKAVKVLVATATGVDEFGETGGAGDAILQTSLTSADIMYVKIYIYWDGTDGDVTTNNIANLQNTTVTVTFTGTVVTGA